MSIVFTFKQQGTLTVQAPFNDGTYHVSSSHPFHTGSGTHGHNKIFLRTNNLDDYTSKCWACRLYVESIGKFNYKNGNLYKWFIDSGSYSDKDEQIMGADFFGSFPSSFNVEKIKPNEKAFSSLQISDKDE
jgi:hypothetical protein